jgi:hypothetical protein
MPLTPRSEPRRKGSPRWFLVIWLVVIAFRLWPLNHALALVLVAVSAVLLLSGLRRTERTAWPGAAPTTIPTATPDPSERSIETITMPPAPPDARPIEPEMGGATGKLLVLAIVLLGLGLLAAWLFRSQGWKLTP